MKTYLEKMTNKNWVVKLGIMAVFLLIACMTIVHVRSGQILAQSDFIFHMNRIETFKEAIQSHQWFSFRNFTTFNQIGTANNYFYPYVYMWLWAVLFATFPNPVTAYYLGLFLIVMVGLVITYCCVLRLTKSRLQAVLVAVFFMTVPYHVFLLNGNSVLGETLGYTFVPLFFLGCHELFQGKRWWVIAIALTLTVYAHLLMFAIELTIVLTYYLLSLFSRDRRGERFWMASKAAGLFLLLTAFFWIPFVQALLRTKIQTTVDLPTVAWLSDLGNILQNMVSNNPIVANPGLVPLIAFILIIVKWRTLPVPYRWVGGTGGLLLLGSTSLFPWYLLPHAFQNMIQFPYRLYGITSFCLILVGVRIVTDLVDRTGDTADYKMSRRILAVIAVAVSVVLYSSAINLTNRQMNSEISYTAVKAPSYKKSFTIRYKLDQHNFRTLFIAPRQFFGTIDYAPKVTWQDDHQESLLKHRVLVGQRTVASQHYASVTGITYTFNLKHAARVDVPVLHYGNERVLVNGRQQTARQSSRGSTSVAARAGKNRVEISAPVPTTFKVLLVISGATWLTLIGMGIRRRVQA